MNEFRIEWNEINKPKKAMNEKENVSLKAEHQNKKKVEGFVDGWNEFATTVNSTQYIVTSNVYFLIITIQSKTD